MDVQTQLDAALAGRYAIDREIGRGGMATVYLARDVKHDRHVALKVLNPELGAVLGVERFLSEIKVTANLQHPNLLPLFDSGEVDGLLFYVMPFVDGESLRHRLAREKQLPVEEAVRIAVAIAHALEYAHAHGVIHRDLKPENILLQHGQPVIADFGIALAVSNAGGGRITQTGLSLGTPQYMSPEQATGDRAIDGRTDIYSLAAMLYEMLTGEAPHAGATAQAVIAKLMTEEVRPLGVLRRRVPPHVDIAVRRALQKLPADRFANASQFAEALVSPASGSLSQTTLEREHAGAISGLPVRSRLRAVTMIPWAIAAAGVATAMFLWVTREQTPAHPPVHFNLSIPPGMTFDPVRADMMPTPDGSSIVYTAAMTGVTKIFVRSLSEDEPRALAGTEGAMGLFMSPDGAWVGFRDLEGLKKIPIAGGTAVLLVPMASFGGACWARNDDIIFSKGTGSGLWRVPAAGGVATAMTKLDGSRGETGHGSPTCVWDEDAVIMTISVNALNRELALATFDGKITKLGQAGTNPIFVRPSSVIYATPTASVNIAELDRGAARLKDAGLPIVQAAYVRPNGTALIGASTNGAVLTYVRGVPVSRLGIIAGFGPVQLLPGEARRYRHPRVSPDGTRIAVDVATNDGKQDIWIYEITSGALTRLTFDGRSADPIWSPDGKRIAYSRSDSAALATETYEAPADGSGSPRLLVGGRGSQWPGAWLPDGKSFLFDEINPGPMMHLAMLAPDGTRTVIVESPQSSARLPALSPNGRWLAYTANESGRSEVYVRGMQGAGRWQVSVNGGTQPAWARDGKTLFYRTDTHIVAARIADGGAFGVSERRDFIEDRFARENTINFDAMPGNRLAVIVPADGGVQLNVIVNWAEELKRRRGRD